MSHANFKLPIQGKLPLTGIDVVATEETDDTRNAFEISGNFINITDKYELLEWMISIYFCYNSGPMIESIVVLCSNKEDRQQWIEHLTQDQTSSLVRSPTMSHVSRSKQPFTRLSKYYARLVRKKVITPQLMKKLLYLQYIYKPDLTIVKMRKCTVTYTIYPTQSQHSVSSSVREDTTGRERKNSVLKSTLMLDVRYAVDCQDLRNLGTETTHVPLGSSSSLGLIDSSCRNNRPPTYETCKSLPSVVQSASGLTPHLYKFHGSNIIVPTLPLRDNSDNDSEDDCNFEHWSLAMNTVDWSTIEPPRNFYELSSLESVRLGNSPSQLTTIQENAFDTEKMDCCSSSGTGRLLPTIGSLHSSDSGMADSYRLNSSDMNSCYRYILAHPRGRDDETNLAQTSHSDSDNDERNFEHQCICSSPFGSTPRDSDRSFESTESANSSFVAYKSTTIGKEDPSENNNENVACAAMTSMQITPKFVFDNANRKRSTQPIPYAHRNVYKRVGRREMRDIKRTAIHLNYDPEQPTEIYTSGLYAHWWLKKKIPGISGILEQGKLLPWHGCFPFFYHSYKLKIYICIYIFSSLRFATNKS